MVRMPPNVPSRTATMTAFAPPTIAVRIGKRASRWRNGAAERALKRLAMPAHGPRSELTFGSRSVALDGDGFGQVENDGDGKSMPLAGKCDQTLARLRLDIGRIDDGETAPLETLLDHIAQHVERIASRALIILVVGDPAAHRVRGHDFGR